MANRAKWNDLVFHVGDLVKIHQKIVESGKERTQVFEGVVISIKGREENKSFIVRRIAVGNIGVERIWPLNSPWILKVEVIKKGKVRRAKLYYLRKKKGRKAVKVKVKEKKKRKDDRVKRGSSRVKRDKKKKFGQPRRKPRPQTSKK